jgi:hypothetical protein
LTAVLFVLTKLLSAVPAAVVVAVDMVVVEVVVVC